MSIRAKDYFDALKRRETTIVVDDAETGEMICRHGFRVVSYDDHDFQAEGQPPALIVVRNLNTHDRLNELWEETGSVVAHLALAKFNNSLACVEYSFSRLLQIDFEAVLQQRAAYYDSVMACRRIDIETSAGRLVCHPTDEIQIANADDELSVGWLYSVSEFLESSIVNIESKQSSFSVDGDFSFDGLVFLSNRTIVRTEFSPTIDQFIASVGSGNNRAKFVQNELVELVIGGEDVSREFLPMLSGRGRQQQATEFAFGCVKYPEVPDWSFNTFINEGSHGVHVGIGMGLEIPHLDFVSNAAVSHFRS